MNKAMNRNTLLIVLFAIVVSIGCGLNKNDATSSEKALFVGTWRQDDNKDYQIPGYGNASIVLNNDGTAAYEHEYTKLYGTWQLTNLDTMKVILLTDTVENNYDNEKSMTKYGSGIGDYYYKYLILNVVEFSDSDLYIKYIGQRGYYENFQVHYFRKVKTP